MGSDGHSPRRRQPKMVDAYKEVCRWAGVSVADRIFSTNGMGIMQGWQKLKIHQARAAQESLVLAVLFVEPVEAGFDIPKGCQEISRWLSAATPTGTVFWSDATPPDSSRGASKGLASGARRFRALIVAGHLALDTSRGASFEVAPFSWERVRAKTALSGGL